jgi:transposase
MTRKKAKNKSKSDEENPVLSMRLLERYLDEIILDSETLTYKELIVKYNCSRSTLYDLFKKYNHEKPVILNRVYDSPVLERLIKHKDEIISDSTIMTQEELCVKYDCSVPLLCKLFRFVGFEKTDIKKLRKNRHSGLVLNDYKDVILRWNRTDMTYNMMVSELNRIYGVSIHYSTLIRTLRIWGVYTRYTTRYGLSKQQCNYLLQEYAHGRQLNDILIGFRNIFNRTLSKSQLIRMLMDLNAYVSNKEK